MTDEELDKFILKLKASLRRSSALDRNYAEPTTKQLLAHTLHALVETGKERLVPKRVAVCTPKGVDCLCNAAIY